MNHQPKPPQLMIHRSDSSFVPDQSTDNSYIIRKEEQDAEQVQVPTKGKYL